jgi:hypothetical protein
MIMIERCNGAVEISDLELDGNLGALQIGGKHGNSGWQLPGDGVMLFENSGPERVSRIYTHHHPRDGIYLRSPPTRTASTTIVNVRSEFNVRQGCSITGGRGYNFERCAFRHTAKSGMKSAPAAGVDIEAEGGGTIRDLSFTNCEFSDNEGCGLLADTGDSQSARFHACKFIGTSTWSAWPKKPDFRFDDCLFVGSIVHAYADADPDRAAKFHNCQFRDDPKLSPTSEVRGSTNHVGPIANLAHDQNVLFDHCDFTLTHDAQLPWSVHSIYSNCTMSQRSPHVSHPRGVYLGVDRISGNADLGHSIIRADVILNGKRVPRTG